MKIRALNSFCVVVDGEIISVGYDQVIDLPADTAQELINSGLAEKYEGESPDLQIDSFLGEADATIPRGARKMVDVPVKMPEGYKIIAFRTVMFRKTGGVTGTTDCRLGGFQTYGGELGVQVAVINTNAEADEDVRITVMALARR